MSSSCVLLLALVSLLVSFGSFLCFSKWKRECGDFRSGRESVGIVEVEERALGFSEWKRECWDLCSVRECWAFRRGRVVSFEEEGLCL